MGDMLERRILWGLSMSVDCGDAHMIVFGADTLSPPRSGDAHRRVFLKGTFVGHIVEGHNQRLEE